MCKDENKYQIVAFVFDSGKINSSSYGEVVFKSMLKNKELCKNKQKMIISLGDILIKKSVIDLEPYIINDEHCTINLQELTNFNDYPFCWIIEDINLKIAKSLNDRLKKEQPGYVGMFVIDINNTDVRKQFWKNLCRDFAIFNDSITCFENPENTGAFRYSHTAQSLGFNIKYCKEAEFASIDELEELQSLNIKSNNDLRIIKNDKRSIDLVDRDLLNMNFMLCKELQISGALIWTAINDIDKVNFSKNYFNDEINDHLLEYSFLCLYHASQGIERVQKIIIEMICKKEHLKINEKQKVYDLLLSHNHLGLNDWIAQKENISFDKGCIKLINVVQKFYTELRYNRFSDNKNNKNSSEIDLLTTLVNDKNLDARNIKLQFGKSLGEIAHIYYKLIDKLCSEMNLYVYELEFDSVASIVFNYQKESSNLYEELKRRQQAKKELLFYFLKNKPKNFNSIFKSISPLHFEKALICEYLSSIINDTTDNTNLYNDVDFFYDELCKKNKTNWKQHFDAISNFIDVIYNRLAMKNK